MVRVEPPEGPGHGPAGPHDRAVHIDGQPGQPEPLDLLAQQVPPRAGPKGRAGPIAPFD
jgi:hypothetical protein